MIGHIASNPYHYCPYTHINIYNMHTIIITRRCHDFQPTVKLPNWSRQKKHTHTQQIQSVQRCWIKSTHSTDCHTHTHARAPYTKLVECYNKSANPNSCLLVVRTHSFCTWCVWTCICMLCECTVEFRPLTTIGHRRNWSESVENAINFWKETRLEQQLKINAAQTTKR